MAELTVLYDGECGLCRAAAARLRSYDRDARLELLPVQAESVGGRYPELDRERALGSMLAVDAAGRQYWGVDAYAAIGARLPGWRRMAWLLRVPGFHYAATQVYALVARHRYRWNAGGHDPKQECTDAACQRHGVR